MSDEEYYYDDDEDDVDVGGGDESDEDGEELGMLPPSPRTAVLYLLPQQKLLLRGRLNTKYFLMMI